VEGGPAKMPLQQHRILTTNYNKAINAKKAGTHFLVYRNPIK
jgi:hypothetical protein